MEPVLDIWLQASITAHDFIAAEFWHAQLEAMQHHYLPATRVFTFAQAGNVLGFYALHDGHLAAIFVAPAHQGLGIGKQLLTHAKQQAAKLTLTVYQDNIASYQFYLAQGFEVVSEGVCTHTDYKEYNMCYQVREDVSSIAT